MTNRKENGGPRTDIYPRATYSAHYFLFAFMTLYVTVKIRAMRPFETSVNFCPITQLPFPEHSILHVHRRENLSSHGEVYILGYNALCYVKI
jgi:hypothetical protein